MINKRGDIPITILVVEVIAICSLAIFSFISSNFFSSSVFLATSSLENINVMINDYSFYKTVGLSDGEIEKLLNIQTDNFGRKYIYYERRAIKSRLGLRGKEFIFSAKYYIR